MYRFLSCAIYRTHTAVAWPVVVVSKKLLILQVSFPKLTFVVFPAVFRFFCCSCGLSMELIPVCLLSRHWLLWAGNGLSDPARDGWRALQSQPQQQTSDLGQGLSTRSLLCLSYQEPRPSLYNHHCHCVERYCVLGLNRFASLPVGTLPTLPFLSCGFP